MGVIASSLPTKADAIYLKSLTDNKPVTLRLTDGMQTTVLQVKEKIRDLQGHPVKLQRLIFAGRVLSDDMTLSDYNMEYQVTVHLVLRGDADV